MGACSAWIFERCDAGRLIGVSAVSTARVDVRHSKRASALRVEIGVEHAIAAAELELEARALADLQRGRSKMANELVRSETHDFAAHARCRYNRSRLGDRRLLRRSHTGGER